jgi:hypothetical protein
MGISAKVRYAKIQGWLYNSWAGAAIKAHAVFVPMTAENTRVLMAPQRELALWTIGLEGEQRAIETIEVVQQLGWTYTMTEVIKEKLRAWMLAIVGGRGPLAEKAMMDSRAAWEKGQPNTLWGQIEEILRAIGVQDGRKLFREATIKERKRTS